MGRTVILVGSLGMPASVPSEEVESALRAGFRRPNAKDRARWAAAIVGTGVDQRTRDIALVAYALMARQERRACPRGVRRLARHRPDQAKVARRGSRRLGLREVAEVSTP